MLHCAWPIWAPLLLLTASMSAVPPREEAKSCETTFDSVSMMQVASSWSRRGDHKAAADLDADPNSPLQDAATILEPTPGAAETANVMQVQPAQPSSPLEDSAAPQPEPAELAVVPVAPEGSAPAVAAPNMAEQATQSAQSPLPLDDSAQPQPESAELASPAQAANQATPTDSAPAVVAPNMAEQAAAAPQPIAAKSISIGNLPAQAGKLDPNEAELAGPDQANFDDKTKTTTLTATQKLTIVVSGLPVSTTMSPGAQKKLALKKAQIKKQEAADEAEAAATQTKKMDKKFATMETKLKGKLTTTEAPYTTKMTIINTFTGNKHRHETISVRIDGLTRAPTSGTKAPTKSKKSSKSEAGTKKGASQKAPVVHVHVAPTPTTPPTAPPTTTTTRASIAQRIKNGVSSAMNKILGRKPATTLPPLPPPMPGYPGVPIPVSTSPRCCPCPLVKKSLGSRVWGGIKNAASKVNVFSRRRRTVTTTPPPECCVCPVSTASLAPATAVMPPLKGDFEEIAPPQEESDMSALEELRLRT